MRTLRRKGYNEINHLFKTLVLPNLLHALAVYGASESDLSTVQGFLHRCFKHQFCSKHSNVYNLLETQDRNIFKKVSSCLLRRLSTVSLGAAKYRSKRQRVRGIGGVLAPVSESTTLNKLFYSASEQS